MKASRSLFFSLALIALGVIWLLASTQVIPEANLWALLQFAPYLLIVLGVGLVLRTRWQAAGIIASVVVVAGAVLSVIFASQLGWAHAPAWVNGGDFGGGGVAGSGRVQAETRSVQGVRAVAISYPAQVVIRQGDSESLVIEAEDNLLPQLSSQVVFGTLTFKNNQADWNLRVNPTQPVKITLTVKDLQSIDFSSSGTVQVVNLNTDALQLGLSGECQASLSGLHVRRLQARLSGQGNIQADGAADQLELEISGQGNFKGEGLTSLTANVQISGNGDATLRVKNSLSAQVSGDGNVSYYGSPTVSQQISGNGSVKKIGD